MANELKTEKKVLAVSLLCQGSSIRSIERITGIHRDTIMRLGVGIGDACARIHDEKMRNIVSNQIEVDEILGFIGKKKKNACAKDIVTGSGDVWTFIGLDACLSKHFLCRLSRQRPPFLDYESARPIIQIRTLPWVAIWFGKEKP